MGRNCATGDGYRYLNKKRVQVCRIQIQSGQRGRSPDVRTPYNDRHSAQDRRQAISKRWSVAVRKPRACSIRVHGVAEVAGPKRQRVHRIRPDRAPKV